MLWWEEVEGEGVEQVVVRVAGDPSHSLDTVFKFSSRWSRWCDSSLDRAPYPATVGLIKKYNIRKMHCLIFSS